jgi:hypothetical protein
VNVDQRTIKGRLLGPPEARRAVVVLHGAYAEYIHCQLIGQSFSAHGYRVLIPAAPFHLDRALAGTFNGAPMFWSSRLLVASLAQWLIEIRGLVDWLHSEGVPVVGIVGHSIGSLAAGLAATLWQDLDFAVLISPVGHHLEAIRLSPLAAGIWPWMRQLPEADSALLDRWAPRRRRCRIEHLLFICTRYDELQPTKLQRAWWTDWSCPPKLEYRHGHISLCYGRRLYRDLARFAARMADTEAEPHLESEIKDLSRIPSMADESRSRVPRPGWPEQVRRRHPK